MADAAAMAMPLATRLHKILKAIRKKKPPGSSEPGSQ